MGIPDLGSIRSHLFRATPRIKDLASSTSIFVATSRERCAIGHDRCVGFGTNVSSWVSDNWQMTNKPFCRLAPFRVILAIIAIASLTLAACSASSSEASDAGPEEVNTQAPGDEAKQASDSGSEAGDGTTAAGGGGVPDWYACNADTFFADTIPVSVVGASTPDDEELGGIFAAETVTPLVPGDNSHCEIFYGPDSEVLRGGNLAVVGIVGDPTSTSRLFESFVNGPSEPETIGSVEALVTTTNSGVGIYFEVGGAGVILTVDSFLADHDEKEAGIIGLELTELVVAAASSS